MSTSATENDRSHWLKGPWDSEPDRLEWRYQGLPCLMIRHPDMGHWCGYVGTPLGSLTGIDSDGFKVHGGVNGGGPCDGDMCHVPEPGEAEVCWLGFDCAHAGDLVPGRKFIRLPCTYRDVAFVRRQVEHLADQILHALRAPDC